ncbi:C2 calcium/lipid-binding plant phosphoribosyltransferase family protein [Striga hermonthica]|uniref:C2 calcium/lipid-binding plant phosphoribosyltransferase family protein n=1 Tax=Striga hermonthica TaxID=68872 RepID=A0A9N7P1E4_STRHE|nr:C2 calcium/lipid-binding plant phosphoribosyltransferase family protein [Striga hermonthica]
MKLVIEVIDAYDLNPKDGSGSASPYVEVDFNNQLSRTKTVPKNLNPTWNQKLVFDLDKTQQNYRHQFIQVSVYNERRPPFPSRYFLGRVIIPCSNLVREGDEVYQRFQLEKRSLFSLSRGEIGLKIYISPEPNLVISNNPKNTTNPIFTKPPPQALIANNCPKPVTDKVEIPVLETDSNQAEPDKIVSQKTTEIIHKHQMAPQPRITLRTRTEGVHRPTTTPHRVNISPSGRGHNEDSSEVRESNSYPPGEHWAMGGRMVGPTATSDLVEQMHFLYVRVVRARELPHGSVMSGGCNPYAEVRLGNYRGRTKQSGHQTTSPEWNQVFAFSKDRIQSSTLEVIVREEKEIIGRVSFDLNEVPMRVPPDSPLAPQWYRLDGGRGEVMAAVWMGSQADEAFAEAWHVDAASVSGEGVLNVRSKVYVSPKLWYLRVNVIEAQDIIPNDPNRAPEVSVKARVGNQVLRTRASQARTVNPVWNEDLVFVAAEPFEEHLILSVEEHTDPTKDDVKLGSISLPLTVFEKRLDHRAVHSRWFNLERFGRDLKFSSRIHVRVCLEGGYHVLDESAMYISDTRPTAKQLWKPPVGILELGILGAQGLLPMKIKDVRGSTDAYCVAKYGQKWVRTRTVLDNFSPRWNEQYTWEVYDPCTVLTIGVFDNCHLGGGGGGVESGRDSRIGKIRIRLSTLEARKVHTGSYPLLVLHPSGLKKVGELQLAVRFTTLSLAQTLHVYTRPLLPKMHYLHPFTVNQIENLRYQAMGIVAARLGRAEPPLRKEVIEYMLDVDSHMWSMRRSKANFFRIMSLVSGLVFVVRWFNDVCSWRNRATSILVHALFVILVCYPELILPTIFLYAFLIGLWNYRSRPRGPALMDSRLSWAEGVSSDELDEEFDTFPTSRGPDLVRMRYDRLRSVAGRVQTVAGDVATQGERVGSLLSWRDPRATALFILFCLCSAVVLYVTPFRVVVLAAGLYVLRHPRFRSKTPSVPSNIFRRLSARTDSML